MVLFASGGDQRKPTAGITKPEAGKTGIAESPAASPQQENF